MGGNNYDAEENAENAMSVPVVSLVCCYQTVNLSVKGVMTFDPQGQVIPSCDPQRLTTPTQKKDQRSNKPTYWCSPSYFKMVSDSGHQLLSLFSGKVCPLEQVIPLLCPSIIIERDT